MAKKYLKRNLRFIIVIGLIVSLFSLSGCSSPFDVFSKNPNIYEVASRIVNAFESNSIEPIDDILSQSALESDDLLDGINYGHELLAGQEVSSINKKSIVEYGESSIGQPYKYYRCNFFVTTDDRNFRLAFQIFSFNTAYPEDDGLFRVYFDLEDTYSQEMSQFKSNQRLTGSPLSWNYGVMYERAGIYNPEWKTTPPPDGFTLQRY